MKKIGLFSLVVFFIASSACTQVDKANVKTNLAINNIDDSLIYKAINYVLNHKEINPDMKSNLLVSRQLMPYIFHFSNDSLMLTKLDDILSKEDISYIFSQKKQFEDFIINPTYIEGKKVIQADSLNNTSVKAYSTISFPLFNLKKDIIILRTSYYCGAFCGHQGIYVYKWINSKLVLLKTLQEDIY